MSKFLKAIFFTSFCFILLGCTSSSELSPATQEPMPATTIPAVDPTDVPAETDATDVPEETIEPTIVRIGVNTNTRFPYIIIDGDVYDGFEIEIAKEIVTRIYGENSQIQWVPITSAERFSSLAEGQIDFLVRNVLHSQSRDELALFSGAYLIAGDGFLTLASAGFKTPSDLDGLQVASSEFYQESLSIFAGKLGIAFEQSIIANNDEFVNALLTDKVQAIFHDWVFLVRIREDESQIIFLDDTTLSPYAVALPLTSTELRDQVDTALLEIISDGTWLSLFDKWFSMDVPWNIDEMFAYPPANR